MGPNEPGGRERGGITWAELFILFDLSGMRTARGEHVTDPQVKARAEQRNAMNSKAKHAGKSRTPSNAVPKPLYRDELNRFKAIVRQIARHELRPKQAAMFLMEDRSRIRRLAKLGVYGHQPGIAAHTKTVADEDEAVVESILMQKVGSNPKSMKDAKAHAVRRQQEPDSKIRIRVARLMTSTVVRWKKAEKEGSR